jgi:hypothetical protein
MLELPRRLTIAAALLMLSVLGCCYTSRARTRDSPASPSSVSVSDTACSMQSVTIAESEAYELYVGCHGRVVGMVLPKSQYKAFLERLEYDPAWGDWVGEVILNHFGDCFDFIFVVANEVHPATPLMGCHRLVRDSVRGVGRFYYLPLPRSSTRLQSIIYLATRSSLRLGPSLHEIMHRWANYVLPSVDESHWGFSSVGGQLGGWSRGTLERVEEGLYRARVSSRSTFGTQANAGNSVPYADLELYLMGVLSPEDVPDIIVAREPMWVEQRMGLFRAAGFDTVSIEDIAVRHGSRRPGYPNAQNRFRAIAVLVSPRSLTNSEWSEMSVAVQEFSVPGSDHMLELYNFWEATSGRASIKMDGVDDIWRASGDCSAISQEQANMVYGVSTTDPLTFAAGILLVTAVALAASWVPAARAGRADPMEVLRGE